MRSEEIYAEREFSPYAVKRDDAIGHLLPLKLVEGSTTHSPEQLLKSDGKPYKVFTPFMRSWRGLPSPKNQEIIPPPTLLMTREGLRSDPFPSTETAEESLFPAGEAAAQERLKRFTRNDGIQLLSYQNGRDRPDIDGTSLLSPYLRLGVLSMRQVVTAALSVINSAANEAEHLNADAWLNQLIWREFFTNILFHFPSAKTEAFRERYRKIRWINDQQDFEAWKMGKTGYPLVDAGMRQLTAAGWMHNRVRMISASFLVKNLLIDWRSGESWFMQHLLDGDPAVNNGSWQWVAGTGTDAAPYFRIFNPITQSKKFDPNGAFIREWIPELNRLPAKWIHTPWKMSLPIQQEYGVLLGVDYPEPIIDLKIFKRKSTRQIPSQVANETLLRENLGECYYWFSTDFNVGKFRYSPLLD